MIYEIRKARDIYRRQTDKHLLDFARYIIEHYLFYKALSQKKVL